jgi:hypothetical protein
MLTAAVDTLPLFVIVSFASKVNLVPEENALAIDTPLAIVRLPDTATFTFARSSVDDMTLAKSAFTTRLLEPIVQMPECPANAPTLTIAVCKIESAPAELVSTEPPLPPKRPPVASNVPATVV